MMLRLRARVLARTMRFCSTAASPKALTIADVLAEREKVFANLDSASTGEIHPYFDRWQSIEHDALVHNAVDLMVQRNVGSLIVTQEGHGIVGIVTERDVMKKAANLQNEEDKTIVKDIMSNHILCIDPSTTVMEAFATMTKENIRHLAVIHADMKEKVTKGLVPIDAMRSVLSIKDILKEYAKHEATKKAAEVPVEEAVAAQEPAKDSDNAADTKVEAAPTLVTAGSLLRKKHEKIKLILNTRIEDNITVAEAVQEMARRNFGAVLVMDDELHVKGIFTERDYLTKVLHPKLNAHEVLVKELCSRNVFTLKNDASLETCVHEAAVQNFRHLPVVDNKDDIVGMLSIKDVVREISREHRSTQGFWLMEFFKSKMTDKPAEEKKSEVAAEAKADESTKPTESAQDKNESSKPTA